MRSSLESENSIDAALSNVIILQRICKFSSSPKTLRLVAKEWNNVILSGSCPPLAINLVSVSYGENPEGFEGHLKSTDSRLFKRCKIAIDWEFYPIEPVVGPEEALQKLVPLCEGLGPYIHELCVTWWPGIVPTLYRLLGGGYCPNLKTLEITVDAEDEDIIFQPSLGEEYEWPKNQTMSKLTNIKFIYTWPKEEDQFSTATSVTTFFADLLRASPNLQKLAVNSFFCPGLETNKELRELRVYYNSKNIHWRNVDPTNPIRNFNFKNISDILDQVKDSLELLELNTRYVDTASPLKIPVMPKLGTFLTHDKASEYGVHPDFKQLGVDRMPSLIYLSIPLYLGDNDMNGPDVWDNLLLLKNSKIRRLELTAVPLESGYVFIEKFPELRKTFPLLERLEVSLWRGEDGTGLGRVECGNWVGRTLKFCSTLGLRDLRIKTEFCFSMSGMVNGMWKCRQNLFSDGLKTLEIINDDFPDTLVTDDLTPAGENQLEEILLMTKGMRSLVFGGFLLQFHHTKRLLEFVSDHKLPVRFLY